LPWSENEEGRGGTDRRTRGRKGGGGREEGGAQYSTALGSQHSGIRSSRGLQDYLALDDWWYSRRALDELLHKGLTPRCGAAAPQSPRIILSGSAPNTALIRIHREMNFDPKRPFQSLRLLFWVLPLPDAPLWGCRLQSPRIIL
jgi:hypothetical protein